MMCQKSKANQNSILEALYWFLLASLAGAIAFVLHETAHFATAKLFSAENVIFHWGSVEFDEASISSMANAFIAFSGPYASFLIMGLAWWRTRISKSVFVMALGFSAAFRGLVLLPFTLRTLGQMDTSTFYFDEILGANALGVTPIFAVVPSLIISLIGLVYFSRSAKREKNIFFMIIMVIATIFGVFAWSVIGGYILPGGHGFN